MKVISADFGFLVYQKIFHYHTMNRVPLVVWQNIGSERKVSKTTIHSFNLETHLIHLEKISDLEIDQGLPVYFYSQNSQLIFKSSVVEKRESNLSISVPTEIKILDAPDIEMISSQLGLSQDVMVVNRLGLTDEDLNSDITIVKSMAERSSRDQEFLNQEFHPISLDDEDKLFAGKRETPRARPKSGKKVKILVGNAPKTYKLFDLSQGGMAFITPTQEDFTTELVVRVLGFDDYLLDDPLIGTIKSVRQIEGELGEFKIGVKFDDGQS